MNTVTFKYGILKVQDGFSLMAPFWRHVALQTRDNSDHVGKLAPTLTSSFCFFHAKLKQCRCWWSWIFFFFRSLVIKLCKKKKRNSSMVDYCPSISWTFQNSVSDILSKCNYLWCPSRALPQRETEGKHAWLWRFSCHCCLICVERVIRESKQICAEHLWSKMSFAHVSVQHSHFTLAMRDYCYCCWLKLQSCQLKGFSV